MSQGKAAVAEPRPSHGPDARIEAEPAAALLRRHGLRVTPQRQLLVEVVSRFDGHFTADDLYALLRAVYPAMSKVTVYRGLESLRDQGLVTCTEIGQQAAVYEWTGSRQHHHLICSRCGALQDMPDSEMDVLRRHLVERYGFHASIDHQAIRGLCWNCDHQT